MPYALHANPVTVLANQSSQLFANVLTLLHLVFLKNFHGPVVNRRTDRSTFCGGWLAFHDFRKLDTNDVTFFASNRLLGNAL